MRFIRKTATGRREGLILSWASVGCEGVRPRLSHRLPLKTRHCWSLSALARFAGREPQAANHAPQVMLHFSRMGTHQLGYF